MTKRALITGGSGQDGTYLVKLLSSNGYEIHAQSLLPEPRTPGVTWHVGDLRDQGFLQQILAASDPTEIYNLAALSKPALSWHSPYETTLLNALLPQQILEWIKLQRPSCRFFQASTSEMFGESHDDHQSEDTPLNPVSPYAVSKAYAHRMVTIYRQQFGLHASCGILFNHESPHRPLSFVSQKIAHAAAAISLGIRCSAEVDDDGTPIVNDGRLRLGNLDVRRDFGFAGDVVRAMHLMVANDTPDDYVVGTGECHSIADFCKAAFDVVGLDWQKFVVIDPRLARKSDTRFTRADSRRIRQRLGWVPQTNFSDLVRLMVDRRLVHLKTRLDQGKEAAAGL